MEPDLKKINETVIQNYIHVHVHCNLDYNQVEDINVKSLPTLYIKLIHMNLKMLPSNSLNSK